MKRLDTLSKYRFRIIYFAIGLFIFLLSLEHIYLICLFIPFLYFLYKQHSDLIWPIVILLIAFGVVLTLWSSNRVSGNIEFAIWISNVEVKENSTKYTGRVGFKKVIVYGETGYNIGDILFVKGEVNEIEKVTIPGGFDYDAYLKSKGIYYVVFADELVFKNHQFHLNQIGDKIKAYIENNIPKSKAYIKTLILADKSDFSEELKLSINALGISHLFAVSGMHIGLLVLILKKGLNNIFDSDNIVEVFITLILFTYCVITNFTPSVLRASLMVIFLFINKRFKHSFSSLDILAFIFILLLMINPFIYLSLGFQLSFIVTFFLVLTHPIIREYSINQQLLIVSIIAFYSTVPLIVRMNNEINVLTVLANIVFVPITTFIIVPLGYLTFVIPLLDSLYALVTTMFNELIVTIGKSFIIKLHPNFSNIVFIVVFYLLFFKLLISKKSEQTLNFMILNGFILLTSFSMFFNPIAKTVYFDIDGEATLFKDVFNQCNILIDTGENDDYDTLIQYLKRNQIYNLDYLVISHFHSDHFGELEDILKDINVRHIVTNKNHLNYSGNWISCGQYKLFIYPQDLTNDNENNNSVGISIVNKETHYFFLGDAEKEQEVSFINRFSIQPDVIKVNHHGSSTSSTEIYLDKLNPKIAYINVDRDNKNYHPNYQVIKRLENRGIEIVRTDILGTVENINLFGLKWVKYSSP